MARGVQRLLSLSLERTPASELLQFTAAAWADALWCGRVWYAEYDSERITEGFRVLSATRRIWPAPADLLAAIPDRDSGGVLALPKRVETEESRAMAMRTIADVMDRLGIRNTPQ